MHVLYGQTVQFADDPGLAGERAVRHEARGAVAIGEDGRIAWTGPRGDLPGAFRDAPSTDHGDRLILPGFVDAHLHFPQWRMIGAYGADLLDWLNRYTFVEEQRYRDPDVAEPAAEAFLDELARHGITACLAFATVHPQSAEALFAAAQRRGMALIAGKVMMDVNCPAGLRDSPERGYAETRELIARWHGRDRLQVAITPRFAVTSSEAQLAAAGALAREFPDLVMQTHLSESAGEIAAVAQAFPAARDYTDVYDRFGLLREKSVFAHGIHLSARELERLSESGAAVIHCPTSNNFLGSGLFAYRATRFGAHPVGVGVGCDIGGGTSFSTLATLRDAYVVSQLVGARMSAFEAFFLATLGNARLLHLDHEIGALQPGLMADLVVLDPCATPIMAARHALSESLHDVLFALMMMGDDRAVAETWIAGRRVKGGRVPAAGEAGG